MRLPSRTMASLLVVLCAGRSVSLAQSFADFSLGAAYTQPTTVEVRDSSGFLTFEASDDTHIDPSFTLAMRFGHWFRGARWLGLAGDLSYFQADGGPLERNDIYPFSLLVLFRAPLLRSSYLPEGQLQPYGGIGPSSVVSSGVVDLRPAVPNRVSGTTVDVGLDARLGLAWQFDPHMAVFWEYRFLYFRQRLTANHYYYSDTDRRAVTDFFTHHLLVGISFRF